MLVSFGEEVLRSYSYDLLFEGRVVRARPLNNEEVEYAVEFKKRSKLVNWKERSAF